MTSLPLALRHDDLSALTALSLVLAVLFALGAAFDPRLLDGVRVWIKPLHFAMSFVLFFGTLALVVPRLSPAVQHGALLRVTVAVMAAAYLFEMGYIAIQAAQAERSHFNVGDPFHAAIYALMGVGAVLLVTGVAVIGVLVLRDDGFAAAPLTRQGVALGFIVTLPLTLVVAGTMSSLGSHWVGTPVPGGATVPLLGWSLTVGDLRPAHFVSIHAMQALPLLGLWLDRQGHTAPGAIWAAAAGWSVLCLALFAQALAGRPLIAL